jgi:hypothetical protein
MQTQYFVSKNNEQLGPYSLETIVQMIKSQELEMTDYLFDETKEDWVLLLEAEAINQVLKHAKPRKSPPRKSLTEEDDDNMKPFGEKTVFAQAQPTPISTSDDWYVLKWDNRYGPFSYPEMIKMLQEKSIFEFDYVWKQGINTWKRIAEVNDFSAEEIKKIKDLELPTGEDIFFRRRHLRTKFNGSLIFHDNQRVWKGGGLEISEGGARVLMNNAMVLPGQTVYLHFKPGDGVPPFNAVCEIISKKYIKGINDKDMPISYGVKFITLNENVRNTLRLFVSKRAAA